MPAFMKFRENWIRPALFFGNNPLSLFGGAITTGSGVTMVGSWVIEIVGQPSRNPYLGIIYSLILPALFILGLVLIPIGIYLRWKRLRKAGTIPPAYPKVDFNDRIFRHGIDIVLLATIVNLLVVSIAAYRGASYMDSPEFCGKSCHVMHPEYAAYTVSAHSHVACVDCHIGSGAQSYFEAKINGTKQLIEVSLRPVYPYAPKLVPTYPQPIPSPVRNLRPARYTCEGCHTPTRFDGDKLLVKSSFADDEKNTETQTVLILHLGGVDALAHYTGIHGVHLGHIEYITTDASRTTIPWVERTNPDGTKTVYASSSLNGKMPQGERRVMDCIDCHNRAAHTMQTPEDALNRAMAGGVINPDIPWVHKEGLALLKATYATTPQAVRAIPQGLDAFYRNTYPAVYTAKSGEIKAAGAALVDIYTHNVFPEMKVTWGTHPNNIGHMSYPGCFRCHDGDHVTKDQKQSITQDCAACHNLLAVDEAKPKVLSDLGIQ